MHPYALLGLVILSELLETTALELSEGFSRLLPRVGVVAGYGAAFYLVSLTLEELPLTVVYGTWAALSVVGVAAIGVLVFDEPVETAGVTGLALIVAGVYCVNVVSEWAPTEPAFWSVENPIQGVVSPFSLVILCQTGDRQTADGAGCVAPGATQSLSAR